MNILLSAAAAGAVVVLYFVWRSHGKPHRSLPAEVQQQLHRELRRPPRVALATAVEIAAYQRNITGISKNVAVGGMLLTPSGRLSVGEPVQVSFVLPDDTHISIPGAVCRLQGDDVAIRFDAADKQRFLIERWVETVTTKS